MWSHINGQSTFEFTYSNENDHWPGDIIEDSSGNIIFSFFDTQLQNANLIKVDTNGLLMESYIYSEPGSYCFIKNLLLQNDGTFIGIGIYSNDTLNGLWYNRFDLNLNLISDCKIKVDSVIHKKRMNTIINFKNNLIVGTVYEKGPNITDLCLFELTIDGELVHSTFYTSSNTGLVVFYDLFEVPDKYKYKIFTTGFTQKSLGKIYSIDTSFNILYSNPFNWWQSDNYSVKIIDNDNYYLGLVKPESKDITCSGLAKHTMGEILIDSILFCDQCAINYTAFYKSVDFIDISNIFFGLTYNLDFSNPYFSSLDSWLLLNKIDENLNTIWQKFYGGDACYNLWSILATQDGGCVMAGTRYDYQTQNQERDVYILKVNENGILTWTYNFPETTRQVIVYPNPGQNEIMIKSISPNLIFELFDMQGVKMLSKKIATEDRINTKDLPQGIYIYQILNRQAEVVETGKWIKN
jgi:hypothetical protein